MDELKIHFNIIKIFIYNFKEENNDEYLFVGDCPNEIKMIIDKVDSDYNINISSLEESKLDLFYGKNSLIKLKSNLNDKTEIIYESIYQDDKILDIKKKIKLYLSDIEDNKIYELSNQYLFINSNKDLRFYEMIGNMFHEEDILTKKQIIKELKKIVKSRIDLSSSRYNKNKLIEELKNKKFKYQIPLSVNFLLKENGKNIIEFADFIKNTDNDVVYEDLINDNDYSLLSDYNSDGHIYLYDAYDFYQNNKMDSEDKNYILGRYFKKVIKNIRIDEHKKFVKEYKLKFKQLNEKYLKITEYGQEKLNEEINKITKESYSNISKISLNGISFISEPLLEKKININKLYNNLVVSRDIPFIYYLGDKTGLSKIKLYEPSY